MTTLIMSISIYKEGYFDCINGKTLKSGEKKHSGYKLTEWRLGWQKRSFERAAEREKRKNKKLCVN